MWHSAFCILNAAFCMRHSACRILHATFCMRDSACNMHLWRQGSQIMQIVMAIGLYHPLDGITNPKYKLFYFLTTNVFCKEKKALILNLDRCCHLVLCLLLILFHFHKRVLHALAAICMCHCMLAKCGGVQLRA
jgi:hypothetical protein